MRLVTLPGSKARDIQHVHTENDSRVHRAEGADQAGDILDADSESLEVLRQVRLARNDT